MSKQKLGPVRRYISIGGMLIGLILIIGGLNRIFNNGGKPSRTLDAVWPYANSIMQVNEEIQKCDVALDDVGQPFSNSLDILQQCGRVDSLTRIGDQFLDSASTVSQNHLQILSRNSANSLSDPGMFYLAELKNFSLQKSRNALFRMKATIIKDGLLNNTLETNAYKKRIHNYDSLNRTLNSEMQISKDSVNASWKRFGSHNDVH